MNDENIGNQIKKFENWKREMGKAMAPLNSAIKNLVKHMFESHPELAELRFTLWGSNFIAKRDDFMKD